MHDVDYTGPQGGMMAMAFAAGWAIASALWIGVGGVIWKFFIDPRIKQLEKDRREDNRRCDEEVGVLRSRIAQLETMLMLHGPQQLRQAMQAALSEQHVESRIIRGDGT